MPRTAGLHPHPEGLNKVAGAEVGHRSTVEAAFEEVGRRAVTCERWLFSPSSPRRWRGQRRSGAFDGRQPCPGV